MGDSMSSIVVSGDTSGAITLSAPAVAGTNTLTLPASTGTVALTGAAVTRSQLPAGAILQVVQATTSTPTATSSTSFQQTNLTASITPTSSSNKILILANFAVWGVYAGGDYIVNTIYRNNTTNLGGGNFSGLNEVGSPAWGQASGYSLNTCINYLDSPATTSSTSYTLYIRSTGGHNVNANDNGIINTIVLMEVAA